MRRSHRIRILVLVRILAAAALAVLAALAVSPARANQSAHGWCELGGQPIITSGLASTTLAQASFPTCVVTVFVHSTGTLAVIYSDNLPTPTPLGNPFTAASTTGQWTFFSTDGHYDIVLSGAGYPTPVTLTDVLLEDCTPTGSGACTGGGGSGGFPAPSASEQVPFSTDNTLANVTWPSLPQCAIDGTQVGIFDPENLSGIGPFICVPNNRLNSVVQTPGAVIGGNIIIPGDLTVDNLDFASIHLQTRPFLSFTNTDTGAVFGMDVNGNLTMNSIVLTAATGNSRFPLVTPPVGSAPAGTIEPYAATVGGSDLWCWLDQHSNNVCSVTGISTNVLTNKTINFNVGGNVLELNSTTLTGLSGNTASLATSAASLHTAASGAPACADGSGNVTTTACTGASGGVALIYSTTTATQTGSLGNTTLVATTPASATLYRLTASTVQIAIGASCSGNTSILAKIAYTNAQGLAQSLTFASFAIAGNGTANTDVTASSVGAGESLTFWSQASSSVVFSTTFSGAGGCSPAPTYVITPILEQL